MSRRLPALAALAPALLLIPGLPSRDSAAQPAPDGSLNWIWTADADLKAGPVGKRYFRKNLTVLRGADVGHIDIAADDRFTPLGQRHQSRRRHRLEAGPPL